MHTIKPIGRIQTPYKEKFAVPRQPRLVPSATAKIQLCGEANCLEAVRGIEQFSHLWLLFLFDKHLSTAWHPTVRPPRLGGNERIGVFASRSTFRPNSIGMSAVELKGVEKQNDHIYLMLGSTDLVDGTAIIDIKPYVPYSDAIPEATAGYATHAPETMDVSFSTAALDVIKARADFATVQSVITQVLAQDPRPAYKKQQPDPKEYAVHLFDLNVKFRVSDQLLLVTIIEPF